MRRLILDHFRRWWLVLALIALLTVGLGLLMCATPGQPFAFWVLLLSMWMGAGLLGLDLRHGLVRTVLALPLTARQIGRAWWFATVAIPSFAFARALVCRHFLLGGLWCKACALGGYSGSIPVLFFLAGD